MGSIDLTWNWAGLTALGIFVVAYALVVTEEFSHLRKSKPVVLAAGLIWALIGTQYYDTAQQAALDAAIRLYLVEFAELFLFLLTAMTYVNSLNERGVFEVLRVRLISSGFRARKLFWIIGFISFFLSALIDNLTTALVMSGVVLAVCRGKPQVVAINCVNIVVAANAGGAFSPFGDITTLMVWQHGQVHFIEFLTLFLPSLVNYLVPAAFMSFALEDEVLQCDSELVSMRPGARWIMGQATSHSSNDWHAYEGIEVTGKIQQVFSRGELIIDGEDCLADSGRGRYLHRRLL